MKDNQKSLIILDSLLIEAIKYEYLILRKDLRDSGHLIVAEAKWEEEAEERIRADLELIKQDLITQLYSIYIWNSKKYIPYELMNIKHT